MKTTFYLQIIQHDGQHAPLSMKQANATNLRLPPFWLAAKAASF